MIDLEKDIQYVKGIGPKKAYKLNKLGIFTLKDLLFYFPRQFEDRNNLKKIAQLQNDEKATIKAVIVSVNTTNPKKGMTLTKIDIKDETGYAKLAFFNQPHIKNLYKCGDTVLVFGKVKKEFKTIELSSCEIEHLTNAPKSTCKVMPIYPLTYGVTNKEIISIIKSVLNNEELRIKEYLPQRIIEKYKLCSIDYAIRNIHNPTSKEALKIALYRIVFEEFLILQLGLFMFKNGTTEIEGIKFNRNENLDNILKALPFKLTNAQNRALNEIIEDMQSNKVMNRLVQGDVGSGKTVVALLALANCVLNGYQGALMAPTEILATQHYNNLVEFLKDTDVNIALLTGSIPKKEKNEIYENLKNGTINMIIGTHALIQDEVEYNNLGLVITDEQHRFGVHQRANLQNKGVKPDVLFMSATPIPRTYALTIFGDMDVSTIKQRPKGRQKIDTYVKKNSEIKDVLEMMFKELKAGHQVYVIAPLIEESENSDLTNVNDLKDKMTMAFGNHYKIDIVHGKMASGAKDLIMNQFKNNEVQILISTTVVEVGVDVPNATTMAIFDADRFGLSTLHQLRGRVGRGTSKSQCILISDSDAERLKIMEREDDGFVISEEDFKLRGHGDLFGTKQSGDMTFKIANIKNDYKILLQAKKDSKEYLLDKETDNDLLKKKLIDAITEG